MTRIVIVGGGLAGLYAALKLAPLPVTLITGAPITKGSSSAWAQGGIAAALGPDDSLESHIDDTVNAGAGLVDADLVAKMAADARDRILDLAEFGVPFDRDETGAFSLGREGAHSHNRIVRVQGDRAGAAIMQAVKDRVRQTPSIRIIEGYSVDELFWNADGITGLAAAPVSARGDRLRIEAEQVVLATGGSGGLYAVTTNPPEAVGQGVAIAALAGALVADMEFVQFHPTGLSIGIDPAPLATEALRGEGAILVTEDGDRFMARLHRLAELAPRDIVARAIHQQILNGHQVYLDARNAIGSDFPDRFPTVYASCRSAQIDPVTELLPVAPAAHYHMGGIAVDEWGRSSVHGLWAIGEVTCSGIHGANRLASNSLLETLYLAHNAATRLKTDLGDSPSTASLAQTEPMGTAVDFTPDERQSARDLRALMSFHVGVVRSAGGLQEALEKISALLNMGPVPALKNRLITAQLIAQAALARKESRGAHFRSDFPKSAKAFAHHVLWSRGENAYWTEQTAPTIGEALGIHRTG